MNAAGRYDSLFGFYGEKHGVDWRLLKAQAIAESNLDPTAVSPVGAQGLSQFLTRTFAEWYDETPGIQLPPDELFGFSPFNPEAAIRAQAAYMAWLTSVVGGSRAKAVAAYNWGIGRMWRLAAQPTWETHLPGETSRYLNRIRREYTTLAGRAL